jgi:hypothetical protein
LGFLGKLARFFSLFVLPIDALTINASFDNQVERVRREAEFSLRNCNFCLVRFITAIS